MKRWRGYAVMGSVALGLTGCGHQWTRPDATPLQWQEDMALCQHQAEDRFPVDGVRQHSRYYSVNHGRCSQLTPCRPGQPLHTLEPLDEVRTIDVNAQNREEDVRVCLLERGWL